MPPLPALLLAAGLLSPVFSRPHFEAVSTVTLVARTVTHPTDMSTLAPASSCPEVPNGKGDVVWHTMTGPCTYNTFHGEVTLVGTNWMQLPSTDAGPSQGQRSDLRAQPTGSSVVEKGDARCIFKKEKMKSADGKTYWGIAEDEYAQQDCNKYCSNVVAIDKAEGKFGSATCFKNDGKPWVDAEGKEPTDESPLGAKIYGVGQCICDWPFLNDFVEDFVTKALPAIGEITCKRFYTAIDVVVTAGINAIPGLGAVGAAGVGIAAQAAEVMAWTFSDPNAALNHYSDWLQHPAGGDSKPSEDTEKPPTGLMDAICGNKYTPPDAERIFHTFQFAANFASAPKLFAGAAKSWPPPFAQGKGSIDDALDYIKGLGKGKGDGDKGKPKPTQPKPSDKPATTAPRETTTAPHETTTAPHETTTKPHRSKCKGDGNCDTTSYIVNKMVPGNENVISVTCDHTQHPQACANYYSAINANGIAAKYTCTESHHPRILNGDAVATWESSHSNKEWKSFTQAHIITTETEVKDTRCEADEFPPDYFLDQEKKMTQLVRWIPGYDDGGTRQLWNSFCAKNDGNIGNGQRITVQVGANEKFDLIPPAGELKFNEELLKLEGRPEVKSQEGTTTSIWEKASYTKAVFSMVFKYSGDETPSKENNWHLEDNPCWPKDIVPEDPGYVLLTDDPWYDDHEGFPNAKDWRNRYVSDPSQDEIQAAKDRQNTNKRGLPSPDDEEPPEQAPKTNSPRARARRGIGTEKLELYEGRLIARDIETNATRHLTREELRRQVEVVPCKDKHCSDELRGSDTDLVIPAFVPPSVPSVNHNALPTFNPAQSMRTEIKPQRRTSVYPEMPTVTG